MGYMCTYVETENKKKKHRRKLIQLKGLVHTGRLIESINPSTLVLQPDMCDPGGSEVEHTSDIIVTTTEITFPEHTNIVNNCIPMLPPVVPLDLNLDR